MHDAMVQADKAKDVSERPRFIHFTAIAGLDEDVHERIAGLFNVIVLAVLMNRALLVDLNHYGVVPLDAVYARSASLVDWKHSPSDAAMKHVKIVNCLERPCSCFPRQLQQLNDSVG